MCLTDETHRGYSDGFFSACGLEELMSGLRPTYSARPASVELVELTGIEPVTYGLQSRRSPN
jgi:hypothetical protein